MPNTNVDERIVEMRIDHEKFEAGAKKAISILEKLDKSLDGLNNVGSDGLDNVADSLEIVNKRFSAMGIVGDQVIRNLTNKAMELVGQMTRVGKSLTIDQVGAGWNQYAEKTSAVQTIMAATAQEFESQAEQIEVVNAQLDRLITFADETSYSFLDMTSNVGKFTSNGMGLEESVTAMQGISTWAALSGANVGEASRAMYNLSQALATGAVKLIDWKSIENANMATREFKQTALETAVALGTLTKTADGLYKTQAGHMFSIEQFNTQLSDQWFSSDVLMKTLDTYGAFSVVMTQAIDDTGELARDILKALDEYKKTGKATEELLPWLEKLGAAEMELGERAFKAAQETKTFREMMDATQDAARTKWMNIFELMFGGYLDAKKFWSNAAEEMYTIFVNPLNGLIEIFETAFGTGRGEAGGDLKVFEKALKSAGRTLGDFEKAFREVDNLKVDNLIDSYGSLEEAINRGAVGADLFHRVLMRLSDKTGSGGVGEAAKTVDEKIEELREIATGVIRGDYGAGEERRRMLTELGYDADMIQWIADTMIGEPETDTKTLLGRYKPEWLQQIEETASAAGHTDAEIEAMNYMLANTAQLLDDIQSGAEGARGELKTMVQGMSGQALLTGGIQNILHFFADLTTIVNNASTALFGGPDAISTAIHKALEAFYIFAASIQLGEDRVKELSDGFSTLGGILHYIGSAFMSVVRFGGKIIKFIFDALKGLLSIIKESGALRAFGQALLMIFGALAAPLVLIGQLVGNLIKRFHSNVAKKWGSALMTIFTALAEKITVAATHVKEFFESSEVAEWITDKFAKLEAIISKVSKRAQFFFGALKLGYKTNGISGIFNALTGQFRLMLSQHPKLLRVFDTIANWIGRISDAASRGYGAVRDWFANFSFSNIKVSMPSLQQVVEFVLNIFKNVFSWVSGLIKGEKLTEISDVIKAAFENVDFTNIDWKTIKEHLPSFQDILQFIANLYTTVRDWIILALSKINLEDIKEAFQNVFGEAFFGENSVLASIASFFSNIKTYLSDKFGMHIFDDTFFENMWEFIDGAKAILFAAGAGALIVNINKLIRNMADTIMNLGSLLKTENDIKKVDEGDDLVTAILKLAASILVVALAAKIISTIPTDQLFSTWSTITTLLIELAATVIAVSIFSKRAKRGSTSFLAIAIALLLVAKAMVKISKLSWPEIGKGILGLAAVITSVILITRLTKSISRKGLPDLLKVSIGILLIAIALKTLGRMKFVKMLQGILGIAAIVAVIVVITRYTKSINAKGLSDLLKVSIGILLIAIALKTLGRMKFVKMLQGILGIAAIVAVIVVITRYTKSIKTKGLKDLLIIAVSIALLANTLKVLSRIKFVKMLKGILGIAAIVAAIIVITRYTKSISAKGLKDLLIIAVSIALLANTLRVLSRIKFWKMFQGILGLAAIVAAIVVITRYTKSIKAKGLTGLIAVAASIVLFSYALIKISRIKFWKMLQSILGIAAIAAIIVGMTKYLSKVKGDFKSLLLLLGMAALLVTIGAVLIRLARYNSKKIIGAAGALAIALLGVAAVIAVLNNKMVKVNKGSLAGLVVGVLALAGIGFVLAKLTEYDWKELGLSAAVAIGAMLAVTLVLALMGAIGPGIIAKGTAALAIALIGIAGIIFVISWIGNRVMTQAIPLAENLDTFLEKMKPFMDRIKDVSDESIAAIRRFTTFMRILTGATFWTAITGVLSHLFNGQDLGLELSSFMRKLRPFLSDVTLVTDESIAATRRFTTFMRILTGATFWSAIAGVLSNLFNGPEFGLELSSFMRKLRPFLSDVTLVTDDSIAAARRLSILMSKIIGAEAWGGIADFLNGLKPEFGTELSDFMTNMKPFYDGLTKLPDSTTITNGMNSLNECLRSVIEAQLWGLIGGWLAGWTDKAKSWNNLSSSLDTMITGIVPFFETLAGIGTDDVDKAQKVMETLEYISSHDTIAIFAIQVEDALTSLDFAKTDMGLDLSALNDLFDIAVRFIEFQQLLEEIDKTENKTAIKTSLSDVFKTALSTSSNALDVQTEANKAGENIVKGVALGIDVSHGIIQRAMLNLAFSAFTFFTNSEYVQSHSPSRAYAVVGGYMAQGLAQGVTDNISVAEDSMTVLGSAVLAAIQQAMLNVATVADDSYEFHPTITPVVDLSNVNAASGVVDGAFGGNYGISAQMTASVNRRMNDIERLAASVNGVGGQTFNGDNITVNVYPSPGQDPEAIADAVLNRINSRSVRRGVAFG